MTCDVFGETLNLNQSTNQFFWRYEPDCGKMPNLQWWRILPKIPGSVSIWSFCSNRL